MNARSFSSRCKRAILNPHNATLRVADVSFAASFARLVGMRGSSKVRTSAANKSSSLFGFGFLGRNAASSKLPQLFTGGFCSFVRPQLRQQFSMALCKMLSCGQTLKVFNPVVGLNPVNVMHLFGGIKTFHPAHRHNAVHKHLAAHAEIAPVVLGWRVWAVLSENFSAARNSVKVVISPVFNAVHRKANHVVPPLVANKITFTPA
jgi:hypothetical protein